MNDDVRFERLLEDLLAESAPARAPARLRPDIASITRPTRQRPRWLALIKEPPMRLPSGVAVGSPTLRLASILALTLALLLATAGVVAVGASILQADLPAPFGPARNGSLIYSDGGDIWIADETGANGTPILTGPEKDLGPWWSHDGTRIAFTREIPGESKLAAPSYDLMVARADGTDVRTLVPDYMYADWSPDDTQFVVSHNVDGQLVVSIVAADGTGIPRTLDTGGLRLAEWGPEWRPPDGAELIFMAQTPGTQDHGFYGIRPDGTGLRTIGEVSTAFNAWQLSFQRRTLSPDGKVVAYTNTWTDDTGKVEAQGYLRDLTTGTDSEVFTFTQFTPDGMTLVGESDDGLVVGPRDGGQPHRTIERSWSSNTNRTFGISPDGTKAYITVGSPRATWIVDLASGASAETTQLIPDFPYWQRLAP